MSDDPYVYPGTRVLRNLLDIRDADELDREERGYAVQRIRIGVPAGDFDLVHLKAIHRHIFQDIYDWAGQIRTVEITKGNTQFMFRQYIQTGIADVHRRIVKARYFNGSTAEDFADEAGVVIGDINHVHPFREGNGRTQLQYLKRIAERAGHRLDLAKLEPVSWLAASKAANQADYAPMSAAILQTLRR